MIKPEEIQAAGKQFSEMIFSKYFKHLNEEEWCVSGTGSPHDAITFGETSTRAEKNIPVSITNVLFFGTRSIQPQFTMKIEKSWQGDYVMVNFGLEAWETDENFCQTVFQEFVEFLKSNRFDWLISTSPRFEKCLPNQYFQLIPTGINSKTIVDRFTAAGAHMIIGTITFNQENYAIKSIQDLSFVDLFNEKEIPIDSLA